MNDQPVSMYVPARNAERTLAECIAAVRAQTRPPDELFILVDPRSSDRTLEVARQLNLPLIEQTGATLGSARNQALLAARHDWVASCDSDVNIEPDWLERLAARRNEGAVAVGGASFENARTPIDEWRALQMPHHWGEHSFRNPFMLVSEVMFDRRALLAIGGYRDDLNYYEDSDLCQRLRDAGYDLLYEPTAKAYHQRSDSLMSLLTLRWKYSEYRQKHLLDRYTDLPRKAAVNHEYAITTLARLLARAREDLSYISFLLFFHHLLMDLRSLHSRRPLLSAAQRGDEERRVLEAALAELAMRSVDLASHVRRDLPPTPPSGDATLSTQPLPAWTPFAESMTAAANAFVGELSTSLLATIESSARYLRGELSRHDVVSMPTVSREELGRSLRELPIQPLTGSLVADIRKQWPDAASIRIEGPAHPSERSAVETVPAESSADNAVRVILHLEGRPDPSAAFAEVPKEYARLVACYQPPARFIPGLDVCTAAELASASAAAGWTIERFDTLVGRTRLMLSRKRISLQ
jgi:glycosyltransferase involved in cell wall biosynthesis